MKKFIKNISYFLLPVIIFFTITLISYIIFDPFKVIHTYDDVYADENASFNRDYISTEIFLKNNEKQHYNSFIFGSSRAVAFHPSSWKKYLSADAGPFSFDASTESIYGIYTKLKYLDNIKTPLDNVLIILDKQGSFDHDSNHEGHLLMKHPITSGESKFQFQFISYRAFLHPKFLISFFDYQISKKYKPYMAGYLYIGTPAHHDTITNELNWIDLEKKIHEDPITYYSKDEFYERGEEGIDAKPIIYSKHLFQLNEIKRILDKNHTNYKVVIGPLYEQIKFNPEDKKILNDLFGDHLYDFSGKNSFTDDKTNYYETSHYRPCVADSILKIIYE